MNTMTNRNRLNTHYTKIVVMNDKATVIDPNYALSQNYVGIVVALAEWRRYVQLQKKRKTTYVKLVANEKFTGQTVVFTVTNSIVSSSNHDGRQEQIHDVPFVFDYDQFETELPLLVENGSISKDWTMYGLWDCVVVVSPTNDSFLTFFNREEEEITCMGKVGKHVS